MKIKAIFLKNFRGYKGPVKIDIGDITVFVGKNDIGKSTILEALDIFFNDGKGIIAIDKSDVNKLALVERDDVIEIAVQFTELPQEIIIDETNPTSLADEYLLDEDNCLTVVKKYPNGGKAKVYIRCNHPSNDQCNNLHSKKIAELRKIVEDLGLTCDKTKSAELRKAIWRHYHEELALQTIDLETSVEGLKDIYSKLQNYFPIYSLFQSDRKNSDSDKEAQDPLREAVKSIFADNDIKSKCEEIANAVIARLSKVTEGTLKKLGEMNPEIAGSLTPSIPKSDQLKWNDVFKSVSITSDNEIPINKRGSGVKRLILLNFFRAEAEHRMAESNHTDIVYAIEEPETSQHYGHQKLLIEALKSIAATDHAQVLVTTHSSLIVKALDFPNIRLISNTPQCKNVSEIDPASLPYPSLNEINFIAFGEATEEYHDELYGYIMEHEHWLGEYKQGKTFIPYIKKEKDGSTSTKQMTLTEKIRNIIHHPENTNNNYILEELKQSINDMRVFLESKKVNAV